MRLTSFLFVLLLTGTAAQAADPVTPTQCGPGPAGSTCDGSGPAAQGNSSGTNQGAGNPINVITGNKYQQEIDLPALPGVLGLEIVRHYNSSLSGARTPPGSTGRGWKLSYETDLYPIGNTLQIVQADGTRIIFVRDPKNPSQCATNDPARGTLAITKTPRGEEYVWTWTNGRTLSFNHQGRLTQIKAPTGEFVSLTRDTAGALVKVTDPQGRSLTLGYPQRKHPDRFNGVVAIDSPVGRFGYAYGSSVPKGHTGNPRELLANLVRVDLPGAVRRHYHFDDPAHPTLLTGISVAGQGATGQGTKPQRVSSWAYDDQGRGILSVKGEPKRLGQDGKPVAGTGIEQVNLDFAPGKTTLTNSLGQKTVYTHAIVGNEYRLLEVKGAGCASCGEANIKYGYDKLGRLIEETKLSPTGQSLATTRTERDTLGRPIKISRIDYPNGKPHPVRLLVRYEYAGQSSQPSLIARLSVIAGREAATRIVYNAYGQPLNVTENGFSPLDDQGQSAPAPIARTITYTYQTINNRSLLATIDGPLPNGKTNSPADSDITHIEWDGKGSAVVGMTRPSGVTHTVQYDAIGRITQVNNTAQFKTTFTYDAANRLVRTVSGGARWAEAGIRPVVQSYRYDELGNLVETGRGGQIDTTRNINEETYRPQTRRAFDIAGRLLWQAEALGILKHASYDTEGNLLGSTVQTRSFEQTERYRYDAFNHLVQVSDSTGSVRNVAYGKPRPATPSAFRIVKDDFGREVMVESRSHGALVRRYDSADRLIEQRSDKGDVQAWAYDLTGQRIRHAIQPKTGAAETTTWRYEKRRLVEVNDPVQTERIRYNERGQPASKTVTLKLANGAEATTITRYSYTADGSLQSQSLPDGSKLLYERNGQGQVVAVSQQTSPWTFFGWGKTTLVKDLERDLIGLRHVTYGNGIQGQWQRSKQGVLARVVYSQPEGRAANPSSVVAASQAAVRQASLGSILGKLLPPAHAQTTPAAPNQLPGALGLPANPQALFDARLLYDGAGNVLLQKQQGQALRYTQAYAYDRQSQLIVAQTASPSSTLKTTTAASDARVWRYHYDRNGNRVLAQENVPVTEMGRTRKAVYDLASNALTIPPDLDREYVWNAQGQLIAIRQENRELARYRYNHHGLRVGKQTGSDSTHTLYNEQRQRIADLDADGRITRQYLWLGDHLIATLDAKQPKALQASADGLWQELTQTIQALWKSATGQTDHLAFVHVNHLGAPVAATNQAGEILWQADYAPYGKVIKAGATHPERIDGQHTTYTLALRLPGQWEDSESGLYYNDFRYYDPQAGRYLSPDPLGRLAERLGSPNAYAYVNNNPLSYIDPWGLILFAFDGTGNTPESRTNVYWLNQAYNDNDLTMGSDGSYIANSNEPFYIEGPGTSGIQWLDGAIAYTLQGKVNAQLKNLDDYVKAKWDNEINVQQNTYSLDNPLVITLDIVGFSRGAAAARDFTNQVIARKNSNYYNKDLFGFSQDDSHYNCVAIKIRFMGLFDTVLSTPLGSFNLGISSSQIEYVAQAVAVNEHRALFPLESIEDSYGGAGFTPNRVEKGFIGAHSDIGGGYAGAGGDGGDLSDVALNWMYAQAQTAGVNMKPLEPDQLKVTSPILHDETNVLPWYLPGFGGWSSDRDVKFPDQTLKGKDVQFDGMTYLQSQQNGYINYYNNNVGNQAGTVDMDKYKAWLQSNLNLTLQ